MAVGELAGKVAIVTGGGSGLGREIALEYAARGAAVAVASNVPEQNEAVAAEAQGRAIAVEVDVRSEDGVRRLVERTADELGSVDVLVAAAGVDVRHSPRREDRHLRHATLEQWQTVVDVNLTGTFLCVRAVLPQMISRGDGSIVTFTSGTVAAPLPGLGAYVATKAGIEGLTRVLALELEPYGIRANVLQPGGRTRTGFFGASMSEEELAQMHDPGVIRASAAYLASDDSAGVTGRSFIASEFNRERGLKLCSCAACAA